MTSAATMNTCMMRDYRREVIQSLPLHLELMLKATGFRPAHP